MAALNRDDIAYGIVEDYLSDGPEYLDITENACDNGFEDEEDWKYIYDKVNEHLEFLAKSL